MRFAFGLVGVLLVLGIVVYYWGKMEHPADKVRQAEPAKQAARQLAGQDESGMRTSESIMLVEQSRNGKLEGVLVQDIIADGPMEKFYGLQLDDLIIAAGDMRFRDLNNDAEMAKAMTLEAYQRRQPLTVIRGGEQIILPLAAEPDSGGGGDSTTPLQRQLDALKQGQ